MRDLLENTGLEVEFVFFRTSHESVLAGIALVENDNVSPLCVVHHEEFSHVFPRDLGLASSLEYLQAVPLVGRIPDGLPPN